MARYFREDFNRSREFVVGRPFVFNGEAHVPGSILDKAKFTVRRLRQLYDQRVIRYGADRPNGQDPPDPPQPPAFVEPRAEPPSRFLGGGLPRLRPPPRPKIARRRPTE